MGKAREIGFWINVQSTKFEKLVFGSMHKVQSLKNWFWINVQNTKPEKLVFGSMHKIQSLRNLFFAQYQLLQSLKK